MLYIRQLFAKAAASQLCIIYWQAKPGLSRPKPSSKLGPGLPGFNHFPSPATLQTIPQPWTNHRLRASKGFIIVPEPGHTWTIIFVSTCWLGYFANSDIKLTQNNLRNWPFILLALAVALPQLLSIGLSSNGEGPKNSFTAEQTALLQEEAS